jgi:His Kinase A (phospho-acceptor) domain
VTATISAREAPSCTVRYAPGRSQRREAEEWQLVSDASHELRTPLTALRTEVELALLGDRDASELRAALRSAADEIETVRCERDAAAGWVPAAASCFPSLLLLLHWPVDQRQGRGVTLLA